MCSSAHATRAGVSIGHRTTQSTREEKRRRRRRHQSRRRLRRVRQRYIQKRFSPCASQSFFSTSSSSVAFYLHFLWTVFCNGC